MWLPPKTLGVLKAGTVLDRDARNGWLIGFYTEAHMLAGVQFTEAEE